MAMTDLAIIRRSLASRLFLTVTTVLTVAVAVGLMLVLLAVKDASARAFERGPGNMQLIVSRDGSPLVSVLNGVFHANAPRRSLAWSEYEALAARYPLEYAIPIQQGDSHRGYPVVATTPEMFTAFEPHGRAGGAWTLRDGRFPAGTWEVVLGAKAAAGTGLAVGDEIVLAHGHVDPGHGHRHGDFAFRVVGVLDPTGGPHDRVVFTSLESAWIIHAHDRRRQADPSVETTTLDDLVDGDRLITGIYLRVVSREGRLLGAGLQQVFDDLRRDPTITVAQPGQQIRALFAIVSSIDQVFVGLVVVVMFGSAIAIMLALYSSTEQRRRQIAVFRVLGFRRGRIVGLVLTEAAMLGLIGAVTGIVLGAIGGRIVATVMQARLGLVLEPEPLSRWTLIVLTATILMSALAGIIPAVRAYRVPVVKNLAPLG
jgi:putative ABC transport system permease protein